MMEYIFFLAVFIVACIYLALPFWLGESMKRALSAARSDDEEKQFWFDQIESTKLALKDLTLEHQIGKLETDDFEALKYELVGQWREAEKKLKSLGVEKEEIPQQTDIESEKSTVSKTEQEQAPVEGNKTPVNFCPKCGQKVLAPEKHSFCSSCGAALRMLILVLFCFLGAGVAPSTLEAFEIEVKLTNASKAQPAQVENLALLRLRGGMQEIKSVQNVSAKHTFAGINAPEQAPYMVQATYQGVKYSEVIPPVATGRHEVEVKVYELRNKLGDVEVRVLHFFRYVEGGKLKGVNILLFRNSSNYTFRNSEGGVYSYLPPEANIVEASVSLGNSTSNIQWLRLTPTDSEKNDFKVLPYAVKPGQRMYQLTFEMSYDGTAINFPWKQPYMSSGGASLILQPSSMQLEYPTLPSVEPQATEEPQLGELVYTLPEKKSLSLQISGGQPLPPESSDAGPRTPTGGNREGGSVQVEFKSPLSFYDKIALATAGFLGILLLYFYLQQSPGWLQQLKLRELYRLDYERRKLDLSNHSASEKARRLREIREREQKLEEELGYAGEGS